LELAWQDLVFTVGSFIFFVALLPAAKAKEKTPISTSLVTGSVLASFCFAYATLGLWLAAVTTIITALMWCTLAIQKLMRRHGTNLTVLDKKNYELTCRR